MKKFFHVLIGSFAGFINGLLGSGGGIIIVDGLSRKDVDEKHAHATSVFCILPMTVISAFMYNSFGFLNFETALYIGAGAGMGGIIGGFCLKKVPTKLLNYIFTAIIFVSGIRLLF